jgi:hypothetical protein
MVVDNQHGAVPGGVHHNLASFGPRCFCSAAAVEAIRIAGWAAGAIVTSAQRGAVATGAAGAGSHA